MRVLNDKAILLNQVGHLSKMASNGKIYSIKFNKLPLVSQLISTGHKAWRLLSHCCLLEIAIILLNTSYLLRSTIITKGAQLAKKTAGTYPSNFPPQLLRGQHLSCNNIKLKVLLCSRKLLQSHCYAATGEITACFLMT